MSITCRTVRSDPPGDPSRRGSWLPRRGSWSSQPVVWLGALVFAASIAGCIGLIIVSARYDDVPVPTHRRVFGVPTQQPAWSLPSGSGGRDHGRAGLATEVPAADAHRMPGIVVPGGHILQP